MIPPLVYYFFFRLRFIDGGAYCMGFTEETMDSVMSVGFIVVGIDLLVTIGDVFLLLFNKRLIKE